MALPSNVSFGTITGRFIRAVTDAVDTDRDPDGVPIAGLTVKFVASVPRVRNATAVPPVMIVMDPVTATTNADGVLVGADNAEGIRLVATDDPDLNPEGFTYKVTIQAPSVASFDFNITVPGGSTQDLSLIAPVPSSAGASLPGVESVAGLTGSVAAQALAEQLGPLLPSGGGGGTVVDATGTVKGVLRLAGDLGGTADAPTVRGLASKVASVIVETGAEPRPEGADVVIWIDADELGAANALPTDPIITPGASGGAGSAANPTFFAASIPPVASRWIIPPFAENDGHDPTSTGGVTAGRMSLQRWEFAEPVMITGFATEVQGTPGAGGVIRFGLYDSLSATAPVPGTEVTADAATGGYKQATGIAVTVPAGEYWVACAVQGAKAMVRHFKPTSFYRYWDEPHNALQMLGNWSDGAATSRWVNGVTGALPNLSASTILHPWEGPLAVTVRIG